MNDYNPISWEQVRPGHVLMNDKRDRLAVEGTMTGDYGLLSVTTAVASLSPAKWSREGFTPHREVEPLPTEPGAYYDRDGDYWLLDRAGNWYDWSSLREPNPRGGRPNAYAPLTRLVPMPTSDAVLEVVQSAEPMCRRERITDAVMALLRGGDDE